MSAMNNNSGGGGGGGGGGSGKGSGSALVPKPASGFKWRIQYERVRRDNAARIAELVAQGFQPAPERGVRTRSSTTGNMVTYFKATQVLKKIAAPRVRKVVIDEKKMFSMADLAAALDEDANAGPVNAPAAGPAGAGGGGGAGPVAGWGGEAQGEIEVQSNSQQLANALAAMGMGGNNNNGMSRSRKTRKNRKTRGRSRKYRR
jgi:hypothetical protein